MREMQMSKTLELRKHIKSILDEFTVSYYIDSHDEAEYPYLCFEMRLISSENNKSSYILEINAWSKENTVVIDEIMDAVEKKLNFYKHVDENLLISTYKGQNREFLEDSDKTIRRIREQFEMQVYERS